MADGVYILDQYFSHIPMSEDVNKDDLECIREWIKTQPHLPFITDRQISIFLHSCYNAIELTKTTIENYYTMRTEMSDLFYNRSLEDIRTYARVVYNFVSSSLSVDSYQIVHMGFLDTDPSKLDMMMMTRGLFALVDIRTNLNPYSPGWRLCMDVKCVTFGHYLRMVTGLSIMRKAIQFLQSALPIRLKGIHLRNANPLIVQFVNMLKPFMSQELIELIHIHSVSDDTLYEYIPRESIPHQDYENLLESSERLLKDTLAVLENPDYQKWFDEEEKLARVDESKRVRRHKVDKRPSMLRSFLGFRNE